MKSVGTDSLRRRTRRLALVCLLALTPMLVGCYGTFPATRTVYNFNGEVHPNRVVQSVVMWGLLILPVYEIATLVDVFGFNIIESWTGRTRTLSAAADGHEMKIEPVNESEAVLSYFIDGRLADQARIVRLSPTSFQLYATDGRLCGHMQLTDGKLTVTDETGRPLNL